MTHVAVYKLLLQYRLLTIGVKIKIERNHTVHPVAFLESFLVHAALFMILSLPPPVLLHHLHAHFDDVHVRLDVTAAAARSSSSSSYFRGIKRSG